MAVPATALTSLRGSEPLIRPVEIAEQFLRFRVVDKRAHGNVQQKLPAAPTRAVAALSVAAVLGPLLGLVAEVN